MQHDVSLADRYDLTKKQVLLNGTQALVRMMLMQSARDRAAGHRHSGLCHRLSRIAAWRG